MSLAQGGLSAEKREVIIGQEAAPADLHVGGASAYLQPRPFPPRIAPMKSYTAVIERGAETSLYVGYVPGFPGTHSQGETLDELHRNLAEVVAMLLEDGEPLNS
jgi:predicted RNase H-like HicB family nuclease